MKLPKKFKVEITSQHVNRNRADFLNTSACPLAMSIKRALKNYKLDVRVGFITAEINDMSYRICNPKGIAIGFGHGDYVDLREGRKKVYRATLRKISDN